MRLADIPRKYDRASRWYDFGTDLIFGRVLGIERLRWRTIDLLGDLDDMRLRRRWRRGKALLEGRLVDLQEIRYLGGAGFILAGTLPG